MHIEIKVKQQENGSYTVAARAHSSSVVGNIQYDGIEKADVAKEVSQIALEMAIAHGLDPTKEDLWVDFGHVSRTLCDMQSQYCSRYVDGRGDRTPNLGKGLRFRGTGGKPLNTANYHSIEIHSDDVDEFVKRVREHRVNSLISG